MIQVENADPLLYRGHRYDAIVVIHNPDWNAGLSVLMTYAMNGVRQALARNWLPVINFDKTYNAFFYSPERGENIWEYFWHPVFGLSYTDVEALLEQGRLSKFQVKNFSDQEIHFWHEYDRDRVGTFWLRDNPDDPAKWMAAKRELGRKYVSDFISVRSQIREKADEFAVQAFDGSYLFAVHIRGTDFAYAEPTGHQHYFDAIEKIIHQKKLTNYQVFLATDQAQFVDLFKAHFGDRLVIYDSARGSGFVAPFKLRDVDPYKKGEDVLIDILLLSKGDHLLKCAASVGEYAAWFAPDIEITDFGLDSRYIQPSHFASKTGFEKLDFVEKPIFKAVTAARRWITNYFELKFLRVFVLAQRSPLRTAQIRLSSFGSRAFRRMKRTFKVWTIDSKKP